MLSLVTTPIGNLDDMTPRALAALRDADVIACEDTRRTRRLLTHFEIPRPREMISYREQTEQRSAEYLLHKLEAGLHVAVCSDGGSPGISDPGYRIARLAAEHDMDMEVLPGASAVQVALLLSGLSTATFIFKGFPPRKRGAMVRFFDDDKESAHTIILFESPYRVGKTLDVALEVLGDREAAVCIELTKKFERVSRGFLSDLLEIYRDKKVKGEVSIVIAGNNPKFSRNMEEKL
jgi:16S rRNA (cytidine1402-2'-O)-methyltransferase